MVFAFILLALVFPQTAWATTTADYVPNEVVVAWTDNPDDPQVYPVTDVMTAVTDLQQSPAVKYAEPNYYRHLAVLPDDTEYADQWHLEQTNDADIDAETAWDTTTGSTNVIVAVVDTGVAIDHPDLRDNIWTNTDEVPNNGIDDDENGYIDDVYGWDFVDNDNTPEPDPINDTIEEGYAAGQYNIVDVNHGTHVAGIIGASGDNATNVTGVNWHVSIMPLRIFDVRGNSTTATEVEALNYARANGAQIVNMSFGGYGAESSTENDAIQALYDAEITAVAAAGNDTIDISTDPFYPACLDNVIGVAASDENDEPASFSNYGSDCVDITAPGEAILSTYLYYDDTSLGGDFAYYTGWMSGTSMATPVVSGIAALLLADGNTLTADGVTTVITNSGEVMTDPDFGSGRINAATALENLTILNGPGNFSISGYTDSSQTVGITRNKRTTDTSPYFKWSTPNSEARVSGYYVFWGTRKGDPLTEGVFRIRPHFIPDQITDGDETYRLRVQAVDSEGGLSNIAGFRYRIDSLVSAPTVDDVVLASVSNDLTWTITNGEHIIGYEVSRSDHRSGRYHLITSEPISRRSYSDADIQLTKRYFYRVRAIDNLGNTSDWSTPVVAQP